MGSLLSPVYLAIVRARSLLLGSSSSTSSQYTWNWRVSGTQNFRFSPGSCIAEEGSHEQCRGLFFHVLFVLLCSSSEFECCSYSVASCSPQAVELRKGRCSQSWQSQPQGVSATVNMALEWCLPQLKKALCIGRRPAVDSGSFLGGGILIIHQAYRDICALHHDAGSLWTFLNMCSFTKNTYYLCQYVNDSAIFIFWLFMRWDAPHYMFEGDTH